MSCVMTSMNMHWREYDENSRARRETIVPAQVIASPGLVAIHPATDPRVSASLSWNRPEEFQLLADLIKVNGFGIQGPSNSVVIACPQAVLSAIEKAKVFDALGIPNPLPVSGPACPECGCPGAYVGFSRIECVNHYCRHFTVRA